MRLSLRRLSQLLALSLAALALWSLVVAAGPLDPDIFMIFVASMTALVAIVFGLCFFALRLGSGGSEIYWRGPRQVRPIALMIAAALGLHLFVAAILDGLDLLDPTTSRALSLLVWTMVPAACLQFGLVAWPARLCRAPRRKLLFIGAPALCLAALYVYGATSSIDTGLAIPPPAALTLMLLGILVAAAAEEVVFRALLLTSLIDQTASRFQAVFLSSVVFAAGHAPLQLMSHAIHAHWPLLASAAQAYAPTFLIQAFLGMVLGVLWLRTGSLTLITLIHAISNIPPFLADGF